MRVRFRDNTAFETSFSKGGNSHMIVFRTIIGELANRFINCLLPHHPHKGVGRRRAIKTVKRCRFHAVAESAQLATF
jgi:hypothetical protein